MNKWFQANLLKLQHRNFKCSGFFISSEFFVNLVIFAKKPVASLLSDHSRGGGSHFFRLLLHSCSKFLNPVSIDISDLCQISDLLLFVRYVASQSEGIKFGIYLFYVCCAFTTFWLDVRYPQQAIVWEWLLPLKNFGLNLRPLSFFFF